MGVKEAKKLQRKEVKERWKEITPEIKKAWDEKLFENFFTLPEYADAKVIFAFVSMDNEPDTVKIIEKLLNDKKTLCVPKCVGRGLMNAYVINSLDELKPGKYGILEPTGESEEIEPEKIDLAIVPCVSSDRNLKRLGHGGGYYDRFMEKGSFTKVLLSYERLLLDDVAVESHDVVCDYLVTEEKIYKK